MMKQRSSQLIAMVRNSVCSRCGGLHRPLDNCWCPRCSSSHTGGDMNCAVCAICNVWHSEDTCNVSGMTGRCLLCGQMHHPYLSCPCPRCHAYHEGDQCYDLFTTSRVRLPIMRGMPKKNCGRDAKRQRLQLVEFSVYQPEMLNCLPSDAS